MNEERVKKALRIPHMADEIEVRRAAISSIACAA